MHIRTLDVFFLKMIIIVLFFSTVINFYVFPSFFFIEFFSLTIISYGLFVQKHTFKTEVYFPITLFLFSLSLCLYSILKVDFDVDGFAKETYRFFSVSLFFISFYFIKIPYREMFKFLLILCKAYVFYNLYELLYINIINPGNIDGLIFGRGIQNYYNSPSGSSYFRQQSEYLIPFIRPFGILFQPQKSAFIFPLAMLILHVCDHYKYIVKKKYLWYFLFFISVIITGAKTALLSSIVILIILSINFFQRFVSIRQFIYMLMFIVVFFFGLLKIVDFSNSTHSSSVAFSKELTAFFNLDIMNFLFGAGFINSTTMTSLGFPGEVFIIRVILQLGVINSIILAVFSIKVFLTNLNKITLIVLSLIFFMTIHYAIMNVSFFLFVIALALIHEKKNEQ